ncbi:MAG: hypothetical protein FWE90_02040 [Defluviitaleaceae bacterium]|nr:hypothetical protein [Defluviitaleaceae bacterium]
MFYVPGTVDRTPRAAFFVPFKDDYWHDDALFNALNIIERLMEFGKGICYDTRIRSTLD